MTLNGEHSAHITAGRLADFTLALQWPPSTHCHPTHIPTNAWNEQQRISLAPTAIRLHGYFALCMGSWKTVGIVSCSYSLVRGCCCSRRDGSNEALNWGHSCPWAYSQHPDQVLLSMGLHYSQCNKHSSNPAQTCTCAVKSRGCGAVDYTSNLTLQHSPQSTLTELSFSCWRSIQCRNE